MVVDSRVGTVRKTASRGPEGQHGLIRRLDRSGMELHDVLRVESRVAASTQKLQLHTTYNIFILCCGDSFCATI